MPLFRAIIAFLVTESGIMGKDGHMFFQNVSICLQTDKVSPPIRPQKLQL
jgi:hypothetical protein